MELCLYLGGGGPPSAELLANLTSSCEPPTKVPRLIEPQTNNNVSSVSFDAPKRTRFTFRPEHLDVNLFEFIFTKILFYFVFLDFRKSFYR
jgi:hypothetical protein